MENNKITYIKCYCVRQSKPKLNDAILMTGAYKALSYHPVTRTIKWEIHIRLSEN